MTAILMACLLILIACMAPCVYRIAAGPNAFDRLVGFDLLGVLLSASLAIHAVLTGTWFYLEISMGLAVLAFVGTVAVAHYVERGRIF
jgi:multicomponent Na+:H+ antiporter subunit F